MRILMLSNEGLGYVLGWQMTLEGHEVKMYIKQKEDKRGGDGFVDKVDSWEEWVKWCDYVIADDCGWGKELDSIRQKGTPAIGGTALSDALEESRQTGQKMFKALGMSILPSMEFKKIPEAVSYIRKNPSKWVVKVSGKAQTDKSLTYVGQMEDGSDVEPVLEHMAHKSGLKVESVQIQQKVDGTEVAIGGFFNGKDFLDPVGVNFEHKKLLPSRTEQAGIGPATGEMGTVNCWRDKGFELYRQTLERFVPLLRKEGYCGYFDINCIVANQWVDDEFKTTIYPLETTCRFGWPTLPLQIETMKINDLGELFYDIACGEATDFKVTHPYSVCVVVGCPPLPYKHQELADDYSTDMPILFRDPQALDGIYPGDCYQKDGKWRVTGSMGYPAVCAAGGDTIEEAQSQAYFKVTNVIIPNMMWRNDIGDLIPMKIQSIQSLLQHKPAELEVSNA